jgi:SAM-dependent methyltransferase
VLAELAGDPPRLVLDAGCGTGDVARLLAPLVERLDAVDISEPMIRRGRTLAGGNAPNLRWITGSIEDVRLDPPYSLVTAGESLHWMEWEIALPRFRAALRPGGRLAILVRDEVPSPWTPDLLALIATLSTNRDFQPFQLVPELVARGMFAAEGSWTTAPEPVRQSIESYVECIHSRNGFSRDRMTAQSAAAFDRAVADLLLPWLAADKVAFEVRAEVTWGYPLENRERASSG